MKHRQLFLNASTTLLQVLGSAAILFLLYRFLIRTIGIDGLGIWSLVLATTSFVALANQGFSTSLVKFVAQYAARENHEVVARLLETALLSVGFGLAIVELGLYPLVRWALAFILPRGAWLRRSPFCRPR
jgi:O-antigen/teichoic acid export membrane protein